MIAGGDLDELDGDAQAIVCLANAALEQRGDAELPADGLNIGATAPELKRRGPGRDAKAVDVREGVDDFFGEPLTEIVLIASGAHVGEGKNGDGRHVGRWRG